MPVPRHNATGSTGREGAKDLRTRYAARYTLAMAADRELTAAVKQLALQCGFDLVGIAPATPLPAAAALDTWLERGWHAEMAYMAANVDKRRSPAVLVPGARSVICLAVGYAAEREPPADSPAVARCARGRDYHKVLKRRCHTLMDRIRAISPEFAGRAFVDTAPVMERALARRAGLGVIGRNGCLINDRMGSYVVLCEIVCTLALASDEPLSGDCGRCGRCIEACPTGALGPDALVDANKCISYLTIEHRQAIDPDLWPLMGPSVFGCDACQAVCPHNSDLPPGDPQFQPADRPLSGNTLTDILSWAKTDWDRATRGSAMRRATHEMFLRNAVIAVGNGGGRVPAGAKGPAEDLTRVGEHFPNLAPLCRWALGQLHREDRA